MLGRYPMSGSTVYTATKGHNYAFSLGLTHEVKKNVDVLTFCPARVQTNMHPGLKESFSCPKSDDSVEGALRDLGSRYISYGSIGHDLMGWSVGLLPESLRLYVTDLLAKRQFIDR